VCVECSFHLSLLIILGEYTNGENQILSTTPVIPRPLKPNVLITLSSDTLTSDLPSEQDLSTRMKQSVDDCFFTSRLERKIEHEYIRF